ncbi:MAG: Unknown protein [uncultured Thiotrichaceae bacterium]|uniref:TETRATRICOPEPTIDE REPEAT FAMILY PROTEIN n=1 Tax=uncultured Thiotrichaceae bacterium TaxID=298394 RepID=A0A6S6SWR5_9GAMM|nr:MAG: Unknown protein [uncultured Thiotrichaceae bacterium]
MNKKLSKFGMACLFSVLIIFSSTATAETSQPSTQQDSAAHAQFTQAYALIKENKLADAMKLLQQAADQQHPEALYVLATSYELGLGITQNFKKAHDYYHRAMLLGHRDARFNLALLLIDAEAGFNDLARARNLMQVLANSGDSEAQYNLSLLYKDALTSTKADKTQSFFWLTKAAESGHPDAQNNLGLHFLQTKDAQKAFEWLSRSAEQGVANAQFNLAIMYERGDGITTNPTEALNLLQSAATLGNVNAQHNLGIKYLLGEQVAKDNRQAVTWLTQAAKQQNKKSQYLLGRLYEEGRGNIKADLQQAENWYLLSAKQGHSESQYHLALLLAAKRDNIDAEFWANRAKETGHKKADSLLNKLKSS